jgi:hypothetical protein
LEISGDFLEIFGNFFVNFGNFSEISGDFFVDFWKFFRFLEI